MPPARYDPVDDQRRCTATNRAGDRCGRAAILGGSVCKNHGGGTPAVKAAAARRLAEAEAVATLGEVDVIPVTNPLVTLGEVAAKTLALSDHLANLLADADLSKAPLFPAYERSLDRVERFLSAWVKHGFDERMVALHERQADLVDRFVSLVLDDLDLDASQVERAAEAKVRHLHVLTEAA